MNQIPLLAIAKQTGLRDRDIHRQLKIAAGLAFRSASSETEIFTIDIKGPSGTYELRCVGVHTLRTIFDWYDDVQDKITNGHETQVRERLKIIGEQEQQIAGEHGEKAARAMDALDLASRAAMGSEPPKWP